MKRITIDQSKIKSSQLRSKFKSLVTSLKAHPRRSVFVGTVSMLIVCLILGAIVLRPKQAVVPPVHDPIPSEVITYSTDRPSESEVVEANYQVAADQPWRITMPTISTDGFLQQVGVDQNNQIAVPSNINFAGWYINSVKPGEKGLSIIDGHVDGYISATGVFAKLAQLKTGDEFSVFYGDHSETKFRVVDVKDVSVADAANVLFSKHADIESQLNLITCTGDYDINAHSYDNRAIVISEKI